MMSPIVPGVYLRINTHKATMAQANKVPIDIISTKSCRLKMNARIAESTPDTTVAFVGISVLGLTFARNLNKAEWKKN